jgi:hypothetical protein
MYFDGDGGASYLYERVDNIMSMYVNGSRPMDWDASYITIPATNKFYFDGGSDTYIYERSADTLSIFTNNSESVRIADTQIDWYTGGNDMRLESDGDLHVDGDVIAFSSTITSDIALKENITTLPNALETINRLRGVSFDWKREDRGSSIGVIAQEVEKVFPELIDEHALNGMKTVNYSALIGVLIEAVKELSDKVEA